MTCKDTILPSGPTGAVSGWCYDIAQASDANDGQVLTIVTDPVACDQPLGLGSYTLTVTATDNAPVPLSAGCTATLTVTSTCGNGIVEAGEVSLLVGFKQTGGPACRLFETAASIERLSPCIPLPPFSVQVCDGGEDCSPQCQLMNRAPVARCQDVTVDLDAQCKVSLQE